VITNEVYIAGTHRYPMHCTDIITLLYKPH